MKSLGLQLATPQGLKLYIVMYREMLKTSSFKELQHQIGQYLVWFIPRTGRFNFVQMKFLGSPMAPLQGLNFYIVTIYREMFKKTSSKELQHQIGQYLTWRISRTGRFNFVQMKSLGSQMAPPQGLKHLHSNI